MNKSAILSDASASFRHDGSGIIAGESSQKSSRFANLDAKNDERQNSFTDADYLVNNTQSSDLVRSVMYNYSVDRQSRFMRVPELSYLFIFFTRLHPKGKEQILKKTEMKDLEYRERLV